MDGFDLPQSFKDKMGKLLGDELSGFLDCYSKEHKAGLRVNTLKTTPGEFEKISPVEIRKIKWIPNGYYYDPDNQPAKHPYYYAGLYYIQEPSAMTPASLLPIKKGGRVLDLCAAPGGKTTELGARLAGSGVLVTNDISNSRAKALLKNVELFGIKNAIVISEAPNRLAERFDGWFDSILVDAPCSGEGMFRKSHAIIKNWEQYGTGYYAGLQREILPSAIKMLRPGGYLLYSTCTFSTDEDEGTCKFILDNFPDMHLVPAIRDDDEAYSGFCRGLPEYLDGREEAAYALRIYPHRVEGEGHFIALFRKSESSNELTNAENGRSKGVKLGGQAAEFMKRIGFDVPQERLVIRDNRLYLLPEHMPSLDGLRILRSGLLLGEIRQDRFEPSQALACALKAEEYDNILDLDPEGQEVIRYLKCESLDEIRDAADGYVLVTCKGFPLGWGKLSGGRLKNKYLPGWRMMT
ncbi:MAG: RsmB/NOP family class I SAM-dependent RNA methyltransferase [Lachnospiraceae bacterium]|nr:RsmB/NOP family class I SAM-dependent RNA methyltransferase [Lachnospiraceae bacterium]